MSDQPLLSATNVAKSFPTPTEPLEILRDVSLEVAAGEAVALTGPSGCGKSTFLSLLGGLDVPTSGVISIDDVRPAELNEQDRSRFRNETVGFVFQDHHLLPQCTVVENVLIPILASRTATAADRARAETLLAGVGLGERYDHLPGQLSGGERQRTALCRALINEPKLLLADEPTGNLDPKTAGAVGDLLLTLTTAVDNAPPPALVCVTHSVALAERFPRHVRLDNGRIVDA